MSDARPRPLLDGLRAELGALVAELREMVALRWELARLELHSDLRELKRLAIVWIAAAALGLTALPLLIICLAEALDGCGHIARAGWLLIFAGALLALAGAGSYGAWRHFRRRFVGLQETLEELQEDLLWIKEGGRGKGEGGTDR
jgi:hypothetical protein